MQIRFLKRILLFVFIIFLAFYISNNWYQLLLIQGNSMYPTYQNMQIVLLNRHDKQFKSGDVVAFSCEGLSSILIKRIAGCSGDTAVIRDGTLYVNGAVSQQYPQCFLIPVCFRGQSNWSPGSTSSLGITLAKAKTAAIPKLASYLRNISLARLLGKEHVQSAIIKRCKHKR